MSKHRIGDNVNAVSSSTINPYESPRQPAVPLDGPRVFTPFVRGALLALLVGPIVVLALGCPAVGTAAAWSLAPHSSPALWLGALAGSAVTASGVLSWLNIANAWGNRRLARGLARVWRERGVDVDACGGRFVELGTAAEPRVYHGGMTNWDVGFLLLTPERLVYLGDQATFSVARERIEQLVRGPSGIERMMPEALYLRWRPAGAERLEGFSMAPADGTYRARQAQVVALQEALEKWRAGQSAMNDALPAEWSAPAPPEFLGVPSRSLWAHLVFSVSVATVALAIGAGLVGVDLWQHLAGRVWMPSPLAAGLGGIAFGLVGLMATVLSPRGVQAAIEP